MAGAGYDVLVVGEVLVELLAEGPLRDADRLSLSFSGDALNAAAAAAAAGASVGLLARIGDDELGGRARRSCRALRGRHGVQPRPRGRPRTGTVPVEHARPRQRAGGLRLHAPRKRGDRARPGRCRRGRCGFQPGAGGVGRLAGYLPERGGGGGERAAQVMHGAGGTVVYDPNYRRRLTTRDAALAAFVRVAPYVSVVLPSHPVETRTLLGESRPAAAAAACRRLGAAAAAVTCGGDGVFVNNGDGAWWVPAAPAAFVVDATGAGDALTGTVAARLAHGDTLEPAVRRGVVAAARSLAVRGGTGWTTQRTTGEARAASRPQRCERPRRATAVSHRELRMRSECRIPRCDRRRGRPGTPKVGDARVRERATAGG